MGHTPITDQFRRQAVPPGNEHKFILDVLNALERMEDDCCVKIEAMKGAVVVMALLVASFLLGAWIF